MTLQPDDRVVIGADNDRADAAAPQTVVTVFEQLRVGQVRHAVEGRGAQAREPLGLHVPPLPLVHHLRPLRLPHQQRVNARHRVIGRQLAVLGDPLQAGLSRVGLTLGRLHLGGEVADLPAADRSGAAREFGLDAEPRRTTINVLPDFFADDIVPAWSMRGWARWS